MLQRCKIQTSPLTRIYAHVDRRRAAHVVLVARLVLAAVGTRIVHRGRRVLDPKLVPAGDAVASHEGVGPLDRVGDIELLLEVPPPARIGGEDGRDFEGAAVDGGGVVGEDVDVGGLAVGLGDDVDVVVDDGGGGGGTLGRDGGGVGKEEGREAELCQVFHDCSMIV